MIWYYRIINTIEYRVYLSRQSSFSLHLAFCIMIWHFPWSSSSNEQILCYNMFNHQFVYVCSRKIEESEWYTMCSSDRIPVFFMTSPVWCLLMRKLLISDKWCWDEEVKYSGLLPHCHVSEKLPEKQLGMLNSPADDSLIIKSDYTDLYLSLSCIWNYIF